ncbi:MAG: DUF4386 domain-containing protein [Fulvivirga sp.]
MVLNNEFSKNSIQHYARVTGFLYLIIILCGMFTEMFVRVPLIVAEDVSATVANIVSNEMLFRVGFITDLVMVMADVAIALTFYILLKPVNNALALMAALFRLAQSSILGINLLNHFKVIVLISDDSFKRSLGEDAFNAQVMLNLQAQSYGYLIALVFFAISCVILGYLFYQSKLVPRSLAILLFIAAAAYLIDSFTNFLLPAYAAITEIWVIISALTAEVGLCLYLLIYGVRAEKV